MACVAPSSASRCHVALGLRPLHKRPLGVGYTTHKGRRLRAALPQAHASTSSSAPCPPHKSALPRIPPFFVASALALLLPSSAGAEEVLTSAVQVASEALTEQGMTLTDACAQELGVSDLNTLIAVACAVEFVALTGAAVGGYLARTRKNEVEKINAQLRQININLRKQARVESYAPSLSYAPVGAPAVAKAAVATVPVTVPAPSTAPSGDTEKEELLRTLRRGKQCLRRADNAAAVAEFQKALALAQQLRDVVEIKKAARGVGASLQRQKKYQEAIKFHQLVLDTSAKCREHSGDTEAFGAIADCYTELGDLEQAAKFYDKYINRLEEED